MRDLTPLLPLILAGVGILLVFWLAPFWTSIVFMVLVLLLVAYVVLAMVWDMIQQAAQLLVATASVVYDSIGGKHDGENDD
jgi:uncharacterized membrane protein SirB2